MPVQRAKDTKVNLLANQGPLLTEFTFQWGSQARNK